MSRIAASGSYVLLLVLAMAVFSPALRAADELEQLRLHYEVEIEKLHQPTVTLRSQYKARLLELEKKYTKLGDLKATLAAKSAAAAEDDPTTQQIAESPAEIAKVQKLFLRQKALKAKQEQNDLDSLHRSYHRQLTKLQVALTKQGELEKAIAVDAEMSKIPTAGGWEIIFRGSDPKLWNTDSDGEGGFARKLSSQPKDTKFLRMRNGNSAVIIPVTYEQLPKYVAVGGGVKWNGTAYLDSQTLRGKKYESVCLGIGSDKMYRKHGSKGGIISVEKRDSNRRPQGLGGWGFGRGPSFYSGQLYFWAGEKCEDETFEISVTSRTLSPAEARLNLVKE